MFLRMEEVQPAHDSCPDHHHGEGGEEQREDFPDSPGPSLFEKSHQPVRVAESKPDNQKIENETKHRGSITISIDDDQKQCEDAGPTISGIPIGTTPIVSLGKVRVLSGKIKSTTAMMKRRMPPATLKSETVMLSKAKTDLPTKRNPMLIRRAVRID